MSVSYIDLPMYWPHVLLSENRIKVTKNRRGTWVFRRVFLSDVTRRFSRASESGTKPGQLAKTRSVGNSSPGRLCSQGSPESVPRLWGGCLTNTRSLGVERKKWTPGAGLTWRIGSWQLGGTFRSRLRPSQNSSNNGDILLHRKHDLEVNEHLERPIWRAVWTSRAGHSHWIHYFPRAIKENLGILGSGWKGLPPPPWFHPQAGLLLSV